VCFLINRHDRIAYLHRPNIDGVLFAGCSPFDVK
jgi:hypothetical protein